VVGEIVTAHRKAEALQEIAAAEDLSMEQTIAVGDGANDLPMLSVAGLGVAFHAKPLVRERAQHSISRMGLDALLYLLGLRDRHTEVGATT
jgi:phosphoserine phosphatase